jgi:hypothetical protein
MVCSQGDTIVQILDQTQAQYSIQPAEAVQRLLGAVPAGDLAGLDRIVKLDHDNEIRGLGRLGVYRLVSAAAPTERRAARKGASSKRTPAIVKRGAAASEREIVLLVEPIVGHEHRALQATMLLAATLFEQIGQHVQAMQPSPAGTRQKAQAPITAQAYADALLWPLIREQTVRGLRLPSLLLPLALALGIASLFVVDATSTTAVLLGLVVLLAPLLLLNASGAYRPSTKRLVRPLLLMWLALAWAATAVVVIFSTGTLHSALAFGLGLVSLALGVGIGLAGGLAARFWWARPIGPVRPPLAVALFGVALLTSVAPWLHLAMTANAFAANAAPVWTLIGAASLAASGALGWWLFADLRQDALEAAGALPGSGQKAADTTGTITEWGQEASCF